LRASVQCECELHVQDEKFNSVRAARGCAAKLKGSRFFSREELGTPDGKESSTIDEVLRCWISGNASGDQLQ
jgi:hypothetical protein